MIIPGTTLIITQYQLASFFKLTNKLLGLVPFYVAWVIPFSTFMIKGYIESIPREFDEAVYMDGGSVFTVFFKVICPLASPAIASVSIFNFLTAWEEFPWALTVLNDTQKRTLPIAISGFFGQHQFTQWGYVFACPWRVCCPCSSSSSAARNISFPVCRPAVSKDNKFNSDHVKEAFSC